MDSKGLVKYKKDVDKEFILYSEAFFKEAKRELARIDRYGGTTTFVLIDPIIDSSESIDDYIEFLYHAIKNELRCSDSLYLLSNHRLCAILSNTHEAGGDQAVYRIKRRISAISKINDQPVAMSVGTVSVWPGHFNSVEDLINELENDLKRDRKCQFLPDKALHVERPLVCILSENESPLELISRLSSNFQISQSQEDVANAQMVIVGRDSSSLITNLIRKNGKLKHKITLTTDDRELVIYSSRKVDASRIVSVLYGPQEGVRVDHKKYKDVLSSIGSSTHQLNQPLQIMMGKLEILQLDISSDREISKEQLKETISEIKEQVHYAAEINNKINRLSKL